MPVENNFFFEMKRKSGEQNLWSNFFWRVVGDGRDGGNLCDNESHV